MGTDIHYYAEKRIGDRWTPAFETYQKLPYGRNKRELWHEDQFYFGSERNYELFEILAGNPDSATGLTRRGFVPISPPRGLPEDLSPVVAAIAAGQQDPEDGFGGHSWLLLKELIEFPWQDKSREFIGYVNADNYRRFKAGEQFWMHQTAPKVFYSCDDLKEYPLPNWDVASNEEFDRRIEQRTATKNAWTQITFSESYAIPGHHVLEDTIPKLSRAGAPDEVRVVFWFDW